MLPGAFLRSPSLGMRVRKREKVGYSLSACGRAETDETAIIQSENSGAQSDRTLTQNMPPERQGEKTRQLGEKRADPLPAERSQCQRIVMEII